jgi:hypothetical protein
VEAVVIKLNLTIDGKTPKPDCKIWDAVAEHLAPDGSIVVNDSLEFVLLGAKIDRFWCGKFKLERLPS